VTKLVHIVGGSPARNPRNFRDVNDDGGVHPLDALLILVRLARAQGDGVIGGLLADAVANETPRRYYDVDGNGRIEPLDALIVLNEIARENRSGNPERELGIDQSSAVPLIVIVPPSVRESRNYNKSVSEVAYFALPVDSSREGAAKFESCDLAEHKEKISVPSLVDTRGNGKDDVDNKQKLTDAVWAQRLLFW
jgi:hypothetical protein